MRTRRCRQRPQRCSIPTESFASDAKAQKSSPLARRSWYKRVSRAGSGCALEVLSGLHGCIDDSRFNRACIGEVSGLIYLGANKVLSSSARAARSDTSSDAAGPDVAYAQGAPSSSMASKRLAAQNSLDTNLIAPPPMPSDAARVSVGVSRYAVRSPPAPAPPARR